MSTQQGDEHLTVKKPSMILISGVARLRHTGARALATRGRAPPVQVRNLFIGTDSIVVICKSGATLTVRIFDVSNLQYSIRTNLGGCKILEKQPPDPLNAAALCVEVRTNVCHVPMLCRNIDGVLPTPLTLTVWYTTELINKCSC